MEKELQSMTIEELVQMWNGVDGTNGAIETYSQLVAEFRRRNVGVSHIQRAGGYSRRHRIWFNEKDNCIEVYGRTFFEPGSKFFQW